MKITIDNIKSYYEFRGMKWPDTKEAIDFAITEIAEALDAYIRTHQTGWTRNNPDKDANLGHELADVYQMISIAAHEATGKTLDELLLEKWRSKGYEEERESETDSYKALRLRIRNKLYENASTLTEDEMAFFLGFHSAADYAESEGITKPVAGSDPNEFWRQLRKHGAELRNEMLSDIIDQEMEIIEGWTEADQGHEEDLIRHWMITKMIEKDMQKPNKAKEGNQCQPDPEP